MTRETKNPKSKDAEKREAKPSERDEPIKIGLDPGAALRALLEVDPDSEAAPKGTRSARAKRA